MKKITMIVALLCMTATAMADDTAPMVLRQAKDSYALPGLGSVQTRGCTIDPARMSAVVDHDGKPWLWFVDEHGEIEDGCEIVKVIRVDQPRVVKLSKPRRVMVAKR